MKTHFLFSMNKFMDNKSAMTANVFEEVSEDANKMLIDKTNRFSKQFEIKFFQIKDNKTHKV